MHNNFVTGYKNKTCTECHYVRKKLLNGTKDQCHKNYEIEIKYNQVISKIHKYTIHSYLDNKVTNTIVKKYPLHEYYKLDQFDTNGDIINKDTLEKYYALQSMSTDIGGGFETTKYEITSGHLIENKN